tara:strand:- start:48 stop:563 length:516 start_codon:yes stop_codon:yes gene_type:complete
MRKAGVNIKSYEPFPDKWKGKRPPDFVHPDELGEFDTVVSMNVLNVLEPELRANVTKDILARITPGGKAVIGVRKFKGDVDAAKNVDIAAEAGAVWINKPSGSVYQKGFDGSELVDYVTRFLPDGYTVDRVPGIAASAVIVRRAKINRPSSLSRGGFVDKPLYDNNTIVGL